MTEKRKLGGLDDFRLAAALLVAAIHTSPLASFDAAADFIFTRVIARVAVPFFFMVTGYYLLPQYLGRCAGGRRRGAGRVYLSGRSMDIRPLTRFLKKVSLLYLAATMLYLPVNLYAGKWRGLSAGGFFRMVFLDGTFYHLWYLPAVMLGVVIVWLLGSRLSFWAVAGISLVLYGIGLFGDSYYGFAARISFLRAAYERLFSVSSYTRNGIFYAPLFLMMGAKNSGCNFIKKTVLLRNMAGFGISLALMCAEGMELRRLNVQRHDSMYLVLPVVMFFLFRMLLAVPSRPRKRLRDISMWIYIIHPLSIILVRGGAETLHWESLFVENSLLHYLAVCALSASASAAAVWSGVFAHVGIFGKRKQPYGRGRAWIELSRENLAGNVEALRERAFEQKIMPVLKADAYGHGALLIAGELQEMGIDAFCVACAAEGVSLRKNGITGDILILGYTHPRDFPLLYRYRLTQTVIDYAYGKLLDGYGKTIKVHVKIDTGMHRLGFRAEKYKNKMTNCDLTNMETYGNTGIMQGKNAEIGEIFRLKNLVIEGIYTHLCAAETRAPEDAAFTEKQAEQFYAVVNSLTDGNGCTPFFKNAGGRHGISDWKIHLLASYGLFHYPELGGDYARVGIALYGIFSEERTRVKSAGLLPVLSLYARIAAVKEVYPGENVGYGFAYVAKDNRKIAVLAIGYADGLPRALSCGGGRVLIHGKSAPIIGRICMDQTIVDVSDIADVEAGEIATVIGKSGDEEITAYEVAKNAGTITNEILSRLGGRLERVVV